MRPVYYNVHAAATPDDNGCCLTFEDLDAAKDCARWLRSEGYWYVRISASR